MDVVAAVARFPPTELAAVLVLWREGLLTSDEVVAWADDAILRSDVPSGTLIDLACDGPRACLDRPYGEFPVRAWPMTYGERFALRALRLDHDSDDALIGFMSWAFEEGCGGQLDDPDVLLAYEVDYMAHDICDVGAALTNLRTELHARRARHEQTVARLLNRALANTEPQFDEQDISR